MQSLKASSLRLQYALGQKQTYPVEWRMADVRFGSKADTWSAKRHVGFAPNSDRESGSTQMVMSALPRKRAFAEPRRTR